MGATPGPLHPHRTRDTAMLLRRTNLPFFFFFFSILKATVSPLALSLSLKVFGKEIMISLSVMRSGVHVRPTGFLKKSLGLEEEKKE